MMIKGIQNISFGGKIKSGDIVRKVKAAAKKVEKTLDTIETKTTQKSDEFLGKAFDNPDNPTFKDYIKMSTAATTSAGSTTTSIGQTVTTHADSWSVYSTIFPSSF